MDKDRVVLKISLGQLWIIITIGLGLFGTVYAAGFKTASELAKIKEIKLEQNHLELISSKNQNIRTLENKLHETKEDKDFFQRRFRVMLNRYNSLQDENKLLRAELLGDISNEDYADLIENLKEE